MKNIVERKNETSAKVYLDSAAQFLQLGWIPLPKKIGKKFPALDWRTYQKQKPAQEGLRFLFKHDTDGVCLIQGSCAGTFVLDVDMREGANGEESLHDLQMDHDDLPETVTALTPTGGRHLYFKYPVDRMIPTKAGFKCGIDVRGEGGLVVAPPSIHPDTGTAYSWEIGHSPFDQDVAEAPEWLISAILNSVGITNDTSCITANVANDEKLTDGRENLMTKLVANYLRENTSDILAPPSEEDAFSHIWPIYESLVAVREGCSLEAEGRGESELMKKILYALRPDRLSKILSGTRWDEGNNLNRPEASPAATDYVLTQNGKTVCNLANTRIALNKDWIFRKDSFGGDILFASVVNQSKAKALADADILNVQTQLQLGRLPTVPKRTVIDAIEAEAARNEFHDVREYLSSLRWDGVCRLENWLTSYMGAEPTPYASLIGRKFLISMVARIFKPGCKVDHMLILEGDQGIGKSTCCRIIAGDWFSDNFPVNLKNKDASIHLRGKWLIECAELAVMKTREVEELKAFLTRTEEIYRKPYDRLEVKEPRQCVFIGTTNASEYLRDGTGNRRFWPITVTQCNFELLEKDRDQLFAEAVYRFQQGEAWWPVTDQEKSLLGFEQESRVEIDPWEDAIEKFLSLNTEVSLGDIYQILDLPLGVVKQFEMKRVTAILRKLGWKKHRTPKARLWKRDDVA